MQETAEQSVEMLFQEGLKFQQQGLLANAIATYEQVLRLDPLFANANYHLALVSCQAGDLTTGVELARRALSVDPHPVKAENLLGRALYDLGQHNEAIACFDRAIAAAPDFANVHGNRAAVLMD